MRRGTSRSPDNRRRMRTLLFRIQVAGGTNDGGGGRAVSTRQGRKTKSRGGRQGGDWNTDRAGRGNIRASRRARRRNCAAKKQLNRLRSGKPSSCQEAKATRSTPELRTANRARAKRQKKRVVRSVMSF